MKFKQGPVKIIIWTLIVIAVLVVGYFAFGRVLSIIGFLVSLFLPFILGYGFSILVSPITRFFRDKFRLPRALSAIVVLILTVGIVGGIATGIIWKIVDEIRNLYFNFPEIYESMRAGIESMMTKWSSIYVSLPESVQIFISNFGQTLQEKVTTFINTQSSPMMIYAGNFAKKLPNVFISSIVFILSSFFMISDSRNVQAGVHKIVGEKNVKRLHSIKCEMQKYLGGYIKAQCIIMCVASIIIFTGLSILRVEYALLIAVTIAIFDALPFFGSGGILIPWSIISFINSDVKSGVGMLIIYLTIMFTRQMIEPKIVSKNIGMNPILTLMSMYVGYRTLSIGGMILGPVILMITVSLYKAGIFDGLIRFVKMVGSGIKVEWRKLKKQWSNSSGGDIDGE